MAPNELRTGEDASDVASSHASLKSMQEMSDDFRKLAKDETRTINRLKKIMFSVLTISMVAVAVTVFYYTRNEEESKFEEQFKDDAIKVLDSIGETLDLALGAMDSFAVNILSYAKESNQTWPFVVIPDFYVRASKTQKLIRAPYINIYCYVEPEERKEWESFSKENARVWQEESLALQAEDETFTGPVVEDYENLYVIFGFDEALKENPGVTGTDSQGPYMVFWQVAPFIPLAPSTNWDMYSASFHVSLHVTVDTHHVSLTGPYLIETDDPVQEFENEAQAEFFVAYIDPSEEPYEPVSDIYYPLITEAVNKVLFQDEHYKPEDHELVGLLAVTLYWRDLIRDTLPPGSNGVVVVFENECSRSFTYQINGPGVKYLGGGDKHDHDYDYLRRSARASTLSQLSLRDSPYTGIPFDTEFCQFTFHVYPSDEMKDRYTTSNPWIFAIVSVLVFAFTSMTFLLYDWWVERRQKLVLATAERSGAVVSSLFPAAVLDRVLTGDDPEEPTLSNRGASKELSEHGNNNNMKAKPIADLYKNCTVFFADLVNFTSWCSGREPQDVFVLLETVYGAFDALAKKRRVYKVETIGDCYVAVTGLPQPQEDHAVIMVKFAMDCQTRLKEVLEELESVLGPGTASIAMRIGLNSGPVTAGVLRGEKSRFQLFGDTVNTAARMESTGFPWQIHVSQRTARLLEDAGKQRWLTKRKELVEAKGKGKMQTYWVEQVREFDLEAPESESNPSNPDYGYEHSGESERRELTGKAERFVEWNVKIFEDLLSKVLAARMQEGSLGSEQSPPVWTETNRSPIEEISTSINFPRQLADGDGVIKLGVEVRTQLQLFVRAIAHCYKENSFHNFEHASYVAMSMKKLLTMVSNASDEGTDAPSVRIDAFTAFALVFAAFVHDADHPGVPNSQLVREHALIAVRYNGKCPAEQNSIDIAWNMLVDPVYEKLLTAICPSDEELKFLRSILVQTLIATDLFDKHQRLDRESRWRNAFKEGAIDGESSNRSRQMTVIIEMMMQAADLFHCMQNWKTYVEWNGRLFHEMHGSFNKGRLREDPSKTWYEDEIYFFDNFVIPLATKIETSRICGQMGQELLDGAKQNREEWERKGKDMIRQFLVAPRD